jgi:Co/Zn/Cd efflux system component
VITKTYLHGRHHAGDRPDGHPKKIEVQEGVTGIHHLHVLNLSSESAALAVRVIVADQIESWLRRSSTPCGGGKISAAIRCWITDG